MRYNLIPSEEFIRRRDAKIAADKNPATAPFRWDSEAVEWHQCEIDPKQTMNESWHYDTNHEVLGHVDYKMYSKAGVHVSTHIQKQIAEGNIDTLVIWMWVKPWEPLKVGMPVEYEILGQVKAKDVLSKINSENRFTFPL
jgi:hypothetical protein